MFFGLHVIHNTNEYKCTIVGVTLQRYVVWKRKNIKYPRYRPRWPRGLEDFKAPRFIDTRHMNVVRSSPHAPAPFTPRTILVLIFRV
jgi:hypothetical protein